jgi:hypothetical protein
MVTTMEIRSHGRRYSHNIPFNNDIKYELRMMWSETINDKVYVYRNGELIYKKWLATGIHILMNNPRNYNNEKKLIIR